MDVPNGDLREDGLLVRSRDKLALVLRIESRESLNDSCPCEDWPDYLLALYAYRDDLVPEDTKARLRQEFGLAREAGVEVLACAAVRHGAASRVEEFRVERGDGGLWRALREDVRPLVKAALADDDVYLNAVQNRLGTIGEQWLQGKL